MCVKIIFLRTDNCVLTQLLIIQDGIDPESGKKEKTKKYLTQKGPPQNSSKEVI